MYRIIKNHNVCTYPLGLDPGLLGVGVVNDCAPPRTDFDISGSDYNIEVHNLYKKN